MNDEVEHVSQGLEGKAALAHKSTPKGRPACRNKTHECGPRPAARGAVKKQPARLSPKYEVTSGGRDLGALKRKSRSRETSSFPKLTYMELR